MRECIMGHPGGCDFSIDECFEAGSDEDSLPCSTEFDDDDDFDNDDFDDDD